MTTVPALPYYLLPPSAGSSSWLSFRHPEWQANWSKWRYARDVYTAEVLDAEKITAYLIRKGTGETLAAFNERCALADFTSHFGLCADALAGMLFHVEDDATRVFGELGAKDDPASVIGKMYRNADGKNTGYGTVWKQLGIEFVITHCHWVMVDVPVPGAPRVMLMEPERVVDWAEDSDGLVWVKIREEAQSRTGPETESAAVEQYLIIDRTGWQRYREQKGDSGQSTIAVVGKRGAHRYEDAAGRLQLPIFRARLPLRRNVGYPLAKKNVAIFNKESERDHLLRAANFPKLFVVGDDTVFQKIAQQITDGAFVIQDDPSTQKSHTFGAPPTGSVEVATRVLDQKVEQFYKTFFREYADTAQEKTATEIRQDVASGVGAFLQMQRAGLDDAENEVLWRLEQAVFPNDRAKWFKARVERDDNFQPLNVDEEIERLRNRYIGQTKAVPAGRTALLEVMRQIAAWDGLPFDAAEAEAALDNHALLESADILDKPLPFPDAALAKLAVQFLVRLGIVDPKEAEAMTKAAEARAAQDGQMRGLLAQPLGPPSAEPTNNEPPATGDKNEE